ncbi:IS4 family transposase [Candidatus Margulisiibacteriota bacterium]
MNPTILKQCLEVIPKDKFQKIVDVHNGDKGVQHFSAWNQLAVLAYAQFKGRDSLRDIESSLKVQQNKLYHLGIKHVRKSTLADANNRRDYRVYEETFYYLLQRALTLTNKKNPFPNPIKSIDATFINLCYSLFPWAKYRTRKGAIKIHTMLNHEHFIPEFIRITDGKTSDIEIARQIKILPDSIYVVDRGYYDFKWLHSIHEKEAYFVIRAKSDLSYTSAGQHETKGIEGSVIADEDIVVPWRHSKYPSKAPNYPDYLRMVTYKDPDTGKAFRFLTNIIDMSPETIALIYKQRWQIELFFKWIKQNLKIKSFLGTSKNAVFSQIWIAMIVYLLIWFIKQQTKYGYTMLALTNMISEVLMERISLLDILNTDKKPLLPQDVGQLAFAIPP